MTTIERTEPQESERVRRSSLREQGPTDEQRDGGSYNGMVLRRGLGDPLDPTNVSFPFLRLMRRDHGVAMGLHYRAMPLVKASWFFEADDARAAAFADNLVRPIYASTVLTILRFDWAGYSPAVKNTMVVKPAWTYRVDGETRRVWDSDLVGALVYKPLVPLRPESCSMHYDANGLWDGISWDEMYSGAGAFLLGGTSRAQIDKDHCSPPDEPVLTSNRGYVPIGELDEQEDRLVVWDKKQKRICRIKGHRFKKGSRPYSGDLFSLKTSLTSTRVTPNHKITVRWTDEARDKWVVYLMRKGSWWRLGSTKLLRGKGSVSGINKRACAEGADAAWIVGVFDSKKEALACEMLWTHLYGIPDFCFRYDPYEGSGHLGTADYESIWKQLDSETGGRKLLADKGLDVDWPFYMPAGKHGYIQKGPMGWTCFAANILPDLMAVPVDPGDGHVATWEHVVASDRDHYAGDVFSLEVPPHHHYVSSGAIVQNSFWAARDVESQDGDPYGYPRIAYCAPIFHMFRYIWTLLARAFEDSADPGPVVRYPTDAAQGPNETSNRDVALKIGKRRRSGSTIAMPSEVYRDFQEKMTNTYKWAIEYPDSKTEFSSIQDFLGYLETLKFRALAMSEQSLTGGVGSSSSRNVAESFSDQRDTSQAVDMEQVMAIIMDQIVRPAMAINMPWYEGRLEMKALGFGRDDDDVIRQIFQLAGQQDLSNFGIDTRRLAASRNLPMLNDDEFERQREMNRIQQEIAATAQRGQPPAVTPTQGRRSLVTQSGFGEMTYVQVNDPVALADDADRQFMASLPRNEAWEQREVIDAARAVRSIALEITSEVDRLELGEDSTSALVLGGMPALRERLRACLARAYKTVAQDQSRHLSVTAPAADDEWLAEKAWRAAESVTTDSHNHNLSDTEPTEHHCRALAVDVVATVRDRAMLDAGREAGMNFCQVLGGPDDVRGKILSLDGDGAAEEGLALARSIDQNCRGRLLPGAPRELEIRRERLQDGLLARYDEDEGVVMFSPDLDARQEADYMMALGEQMA